MAITKTAGELAAPRDLQAARPDWLGPKPNQLSMFSSSLQDATPGPAPVSAPSLPA